MRSTIQYLYTMRTLVAMVCVVLAGCSDETPETGCVDPSKALTEVASLKNIVDNGLIAGRPNCTVYAGSRIYSCKYKGETSYYFVNSASTASTCLLIAYDCFGEELINWGSSQAAWTEFEAEREEEELLWTKP